MGRAARRKHRAGAQRRSRGDQGGTIDLASRPSVSAPIGPAGMPEFTTFVRASADGPLHDPRGAPGRYSAVVTLSRPGLRPVPEYKMAPSEHVRGDSHI